MLSGTGLEHGRIVQKRMYQPLRYQYSGCDAFDVTEALYTYVGRHMDLGADQTNLKKDIFQAHNNFMDA